MSNERVIIAGMGPGSKSCITEEVKAAIDNAEIIIGSKRLIEEYPDKKTFYAVTADNIVSIIEQEEAQEYVVLMSGDTGFTVEQESLQMRLKENMNTVSCLEYLL